MSAYRNEPTTLSNDVRNLGYPQAFSLPGLYIVVKYLPKIGIGRKHIGDNKMDLEGFRVERFRSISEVSIARCGKFNVLVGKNNSGKSNILFAIHTFFSCLANGKVVNLKPPIGSEIDYYNRDTRSSIMISLLFTQSDVERKELITALISDAPQVKHAVDGLDSSLRLLVSIKVNPGPQRYSFIHKIAFVRKDHFENRLSDYERILLEVDHDAAKELHLKAVKAQETEHTISVLREFWNSIDEDGWQRLRKERALPVQYYLRRPRVSRDVDIYPIISPLLEESETYSDFRENARSLAEQLKNDSASIQKQPLSQKVVTFSGEDSQIPDYIYKLLDKLASKRVLYLTERRKPIGEEEAKRLLSLKIQRGGPEVLRGIQDTISTLLGVQIDAFQGEDVPVPLGRMSAELDVDNFLVEVNGSGIREALRLILDVEFEKPDILLVEEPELHLHPGLETSIMRYLERTSGHRQVFITTHSTNFLDNAEMTNVFLVSKSKKGATQVDHLTPGDVEIYVPQELGLRLSSLFLFDRLVFVEGQSDESVFREWSTTLGINLSKANLGFIHMGGVRNFTHYATEQILSFLTRRQVRLFFVVDRDERDSNDISQLKELLSARAELFSLRRRELENYMLEPRAVREFVLLKRELAGMDSAESDLSESEIGELLKHEADKLRDYTLKKRVASELCNPVYSTPASVMDGSDNQDRISEQVIQELERMGAVLNERKARVQSVFEKEKKTIDASWETTKLDLVPGDVLLDAVCRKFNVRFKKERDSVRLASLMTEDEIDGDIKQIIRAIAS